MKKKVLHLTVGHPPFDARIFHKEATFLSDSYDVFLLAYSDDGKVRDGVGKMCGPGVYNNVTVDCFSAGTNNRLLKSLRKRFFLKKHIMLTLKKWNFIPDLIHCHEPDSLAIAVSLKNRYGCKLVFDTHELWIGYILDKPSSLFKKIYRSIFLLSSMNSNIEKSDATVSVNQIIRTINVGFNPSINHILLPNGFVFEKQQLSFFDEKIVLLHEGMISIQEIEFIVECFTHDWFRKNCIFKIIGETRGKTRTYIEQQKKSKPWLSDTITETGWLDYSDVAKNLSGTIGIVLFGTNFNNLVSTPNKLFNYVSAGIPIISFDMFLTENYVLSDKIGYVSERTIESFMLFIKKIIVNYDELTKNVVSVQDKYSFKSQVSELLDLYKILIGKIN